MTVLEWDQVGDKVYESGIDKGVLYLKDGRTVSWSGLTSIEDNTQTELKSYYLDGIKILDHVVPGDFEGKLAAFTYPEEFEEVLGAVAVETGITFYEQESKSFHLSYRTKISNDLDENYGYKIHLLYNLRATSEANTSESLGDQPAAKEFSWGLSGVPPVSTIDGVRPTVHVAIDSTKIDSALLENIENILYGTETTNPRFPSLLEIRILSGEVGGLYIVDNGNGTWTAIDPSDDFIESVIDDEFIIDHADVTYIVPDEEYTITDTPIPLP